MERQANKIYKRTKLVDSKYTVKNRLYINDIEIEVTRKSIKNIHLSVHPPNGAVRISAPKRMRDEAIRLFAVSKLYWIKKQQSRFKNQGNIPEKNFISGESHYYFGDRYLLNVIYQKGNQSKVEIRSDKFIDLYVPEGSTKIKREKVIREWYRKELKNMIPPLIRKWEEKIGVKVESWGIKLMKTRWGTCNTTARRIWINLELAVKPVHCLEYIIVHELVHLLEKNHGDRFVSLMDTHYPNWKVVKLELNNLVFG